MISIAGYIDFLRNTVQISSDDLPDTSADIPTSYNAARDYVPCQIIKYAPTIYDLTVYNLGMSFMVNWSNLPYFVKLRSDLKLNNFTAGVVTAASDESTSTTLLTPDFFKNMGLMELQMLKDPWGRQALAFMQQLGDLWGLTQ